MINKRKQPDAKALLLRMAGLCSRSEQCEYDIRQKLYKAGISEDDRDRIIDYLKEHQYIDEYRFAKSYAHDKCHFQAWGPYKIRMMLAAKRIPGAVISEALNSVEQSDWDEALRRATETKAKNLDLTGPNARTERMKLRRFLISRGFS